MNCPICGNQITAWSARPNGRLAGFCACNPAGPVVDISAEQQPDPRLDIPGIDVEIAEALRAQGFDDLDALREATNTELLAIAGIGRARLQKIRDYFAEEVNE